MARKLLIAIACLIVVMSACAQEKTKEYIQKRQQQLQREIDDLNKMLNEIKSSKKNH